MISQNLIVLKKDDLESVFVEFVLRNGKKNIVVGCVYEQLMETDLFNNHYLSPVLKSIDDEGKSLTLIGDSNIDLSTCDSKASHANFFDILGVHQILPSITLPTRITETSSTIIDNIFIFPTDSNILSGNLTVSISNPSITDHLQPQLIYPGTKPENSSKHPKKNSKLLN